MGRFTFLIPLVFAALTVIAVAYAANEAAPRVEALFDGIVARIDHAIGYPGGK